MTWAEPDDTSKIDLSRLFWSVIIPFTTHVRLFDERWPYLPTNNTHATRARSSWTFETSARRVATTNLALSVKLRGRIWQTEGARSAELPERTQVHVGRTNISALIWIKIKVRNRCSQVQPCLPWVKEPIEPPNLVRSRRLLVFFDVVGDICEG